MSSDHIYKPPPSETIQIHYQDKWMLIVEKPAGLLSVPGRGPDKQDCLLSRVQEKYPEVLVVHRLDMDTSGLMVLARSPSSQGRLGRMFQHRQVEKQYQALVLGRPGPAEGSIELPMITDWPRRPLQKVDPVNGKKAITHYRVIDYYPATGLSRVELYPHTGRTHQLRVHMQQIGHPIVGDRLYGHQQCGEGLKLHARRLRFRHPETEQDIDIVSEVPF